MGSAMAVDRHSILSNTLASATFTGPSDSVLSRDVGTNVIPHKMDHG